MNETRCLSKAELAQLLASSNDVQDDFSAQIEHLSECPSCADQLQKLSVSDFPELGSNQSRRSTIDENHLSSQIDSFNARLAELRFSRGVQADFNHQFKTDVERPYNGE